MVPLSLRSKGMPKCSSYIPDSGPLRHMNSFASWSPSQSEPLMVSYICQCQLSSPILPREAPTPPCAATVCERVGNTLESTATFRPAVDSCSAARRPEPPAPTTTASYLRTGIAISILPSRKLLNEQHQKSFIGRSPLRLLPVPPAPIESQPTKW